VDPHMGRLQAIEAGRLSAPDGIHEICLVGVTELNSLLRRALEETSLTVRPLIFAPLECQAMFDDLGGLVPSAWSSWCTSLDSEKQWFVVDGPADQAEQTKRVMASWNGKYAAEDISIGLADPKIAPFLKSRLAEEGVRAREASGVATADTGPASLLSAVSRFLGGSSFEDFATLVRHPDFEATLRRMDETAEDEPALEPVSLVDSYHNEHLPLFSNGEWAVDSANKYDRALAANMARLWKVTKALLGELDDGSSLSLSAAIDATRCFLARVYGASDLDPDIESDRVLIACLSQFGKALAELETLPEDLAPEFSTPNGKTDNQAIAETLELLNRMVAGEQIPPAAAVRGEATIELLGWLELALDDAPALIVTGFEQGKVPESIRGDAFLPNRLRSSLGIGDNEKRLARDLYATELLLRSREQIVFISGRRNAQGDPEVPSRIVFHCEPSDVIGRTQKFLNGATVLRVEDESDDVEGYELPKAPVEKPITKMSVTAFSRFLNSPYQFYLESILKLKSNDDRARELEPMSFGIIAHSILQRFGEHPKLRHSLNADAIAEFLSSELKRFTAECFGKSPLPAVRLQMEQLDYRLRRFAVKQAERAALGWRIHAVEWTPSACDLMVDGEPIQLRGKIDRIDFHPLEKKWAIWDYKTGETCKTPIRAHRAQSGEWRDLQLPLYCVLAEEFLNGAAPDEIGYISLGSDPDKIDFMKLVDWSPNRSEKVDFADGVASALSVAADVVRKIRRREFFDADGMKDYDPIFAAIGGLGLVSKETGASTDTATLGESS
ncbi:MAG: RecB family exonuclease, partial [Planctomycetota bacterium]